MRKSTLWGQKAMTSATETCVLSQINNLIIHNESHLDHNMTAAQRAWVLQSISNFNGPYKSTLRLPDELGLVPCNLHGPITGVEPVDDFEAYYKRRGKRPYVSRMCDRPAVMTQYVSVITGSHDGFDNVLYTMFGGPITPREPFELVNDPNAKPEDFMESVKFWCVHALSK